ncbi:MAG: DUF5317 domain-containing protein [Bacillota bacterium]
MLFAVPLGAMLGWARGGSLEHLGSYPFRHPALLVAAFAMQISLARLPQWGVAIPADIADGVHLSSYGLLLAVLALNLRAPGIPLVSVGTVANLLVIALNGGMPVDIGTLNRLGYGASAEMLRSGGSTTHVALDGTTRLPFLGDIILSPRWFPGAALLSPGDVLMMLGIVWVIAAGMKGSDSR